MKQIVQNYKTGKIKFVEVPAPTVTPNSVIIETRRSLISVGTERMLLEFGRSSLVDKARKQPEKVKQVIEKIKTDGLLATIGAVNSKLDEPVPLGYSNTGIVVDVGGNIKGINKGDRVISNGNHAEIVRVPGNLVAGIPDDVDDTSASFTVLGSIALESVRLLNPGLGECITVMGLGLIGQLTVQFLTASGCRVFGVDLDEDRVKLAESFGVKGFVLKHGESPVAAAKSFSKSNGVDGVIIATSTESNGPVEWAAEMCRKKGRIVLVGTAGINIPRGMFYEKELSFQVSCSYGPGRYDKNYEEKGLDYPIGYVRWTAQRNFKAVLDMMSSGRINVKKLITGEIPFEKAADAYDIVLKENPLGLILKYSEDKEKMVRAFELSDKTKNVPGKPCIGFIGTGNFAKMVLLPALRETDVSRKTIASSKGLDGVTSGGKFAFQCVTSEYENVLNDPEIDTVFIATRHGSHAKLVAEALGNGKHCFVEKPLALNELELKEIATVYRDSDGILMTGFNRRFAPFIRKLKKNISGRNEQTCVNITVNAGSLPQNHWVHDPVMGGGRIIGEACHFIDLVLFLTGSRITRVYSSAVKGDDTANEDSMTVSLDLEDGSIGTVHYLTNGSRFYPKERIEVFSGGRVFVIDNFRTMTGYGSSLKQRSFKQDKGHITEVREFINAVKEGKASPIPFEETVNTMLASFAAVRSAREGKAIDIHPLMDEVFGG